MISTYLLILSSAFLIFFAIFQFFGNRDLYNKTAHICGPKSFPLLGCVSLYFRDSAFFAKELLKFCKTYTSPFRIVLGPRVFLIITNPDQIKTVLQSSKALEKDDIYDFAKTWLGNGLVTAEHQIWRVHRKVIQPTFNQKVLQSFVSIFSKNSLLLIKSLEEKLDGPGFEISPYIFFTTFGNICESSMGVSVETKGKELERYLNTTRRIFNLLFQRFIRFWLHPNIFFKFSQMSKDFSGCIQKVHDFTDDVICERRQNLQNGFVQINDDLKEKRKPTLDLLLELSENEGKLTDIELREQVITIIVAGSDTTARTVDFVLLMLAHYPEIQEKVYEEIYSIYGSEDPEKTPLKSEDIHRFEYLDRVIKETLRIFPPGPMVARKISEDLDIGGCVAPKGCGVGICIIGLHRDETIWPDPLKFDPDRFLPEEVNKRHPLAFIPFIFGSRDCIGRVYAVMSIKVIVVTFLRKFIVKRDVIKEIKDIKLSADALLMGFDPVLLRLEKRVK